MAVFDVEDANVYISDDNSADSYTALSEATGWAFTSDAEGEATVLTFGGGKHIRTGDDVDTYNISALLDPDNQSTVRDAKRNGTKIYIAIIWDDTSGAEVGTTQEVRVTSYDYDAAADGDFARFNFTALGEGSLTDITSLPAST